MKTFLTFLIALLLVQFTFSKPIEDVSSSEEEREMRQNPTPSQKIVLLIYDNILLMAQNYAEGAANVSRQVLKDELIASNVKPEIMEFKKNLNIYLEKYDSHKNNKMIWRIMDIFANTVNNYAHIPEDKETPESKIIIEVLEKYNYKDLNVNLAVQVRTFIDDFNKIFEENKDHMNEAMLDWYERMKNIEDHKKKAQAFLEVINMAKE